MSIRTAGVRRLKVSGSFGSFSTWFLEIVQQADGALQACLARAGHYAVGRLQLFKLALVPVEEVFAPVAVLPQGVGLPGQVRRAEQVIVHAAALQVLGQEAGT